MSHVPVWYWFERVQRSCHGGKEKINGKVLSLDGESSGKASCPGRVVLRGWLIFLHVVRDEYVLLRNPSSTIVYHHLYYRFPKILGVGFLSLQSRVRTKPVSLRRWTLILSLPSSRTTLLTSKCELELGERTQSAGRMYVSCRCKRMSG